MPAKKAPKTQEQRLDRICELNDEAKELKVVIDALKADLLAGMQSDECWLLPVLSLLLQKLHSKNQ